LHGASPSRQHCRNVRRLPWPSPPDPNGHFKTHLNIYFFIFYILFSIIVNLFNLKIIFHFKARTIHKSAAFLAKRLEQSGVPVVHRTFFDTIKVVLSLSYIITSCLILYLFYFILVNIKIYLILLIEICKNQAIDKKANKFEARPRNITDFRVRAEELRINVRFFNGDDDQEVGISVDETTLPADLVDLLSLFGIEEWQGGERAGSGPLYASAEDISATSAPLVRFP
jgi:glycine cleavage system pyridoxal-binding protein P